VYQIIGHVVAALIFIITGFFCFIVLPLPMIIAYVVMSIFWPTTVCKLNTILLLGAMMFFTFVLGAVCGSLLLFDWFTWDVTSFVSLDPIVAQVANGNCECTCEYSVLNTKLYVMCIACFAAFLKSFQLWREACYCDGEHSLLSVAYRVPYDKAREFRPGNPAMDLFDMKEKNADKQEAMADAASDSSAHERGQTNAAEARIEMEAPPSLSQRNVDPPKSEMPPPPLSTYVPEAPAGGGFDNSYGGGGYGGDSGGYGGGGYGGGGYEQQQSESAAAPPDAPPM